MSDLPKNSFYPLLLVPMHILIVFVCVCVCVCVWCVCVCVCVCVCRYIKSSNVKFLGVALISYMTIIPANIIYGLIYSAVEYNLSYGAREFLCLVRLILILWFSFIFFIVTIIFVVVFVIIIIIIIIIHIIILLLLLLQEPTDTPSRKKLMRWVCARGLVCQKREFTVRSSSCEVMIRS